MAGFEQRTIEDADGRRYAIVVNTVTGQVISRRLLTATATEVTEFDRRFLKSLRIAP